MFLWNVNKLKKYDHFSIFYMLIMIIYMAQATRETSRMIGGLSGNPIPFLIPIVLTFILCKKNPISFNDKKFYIVILLYLVWAISSLIKYGYNTEDISYHIFMIYAIIIAYIHNKVFGYKIVPIYENCMVLFCKIAFWLWLIAVLVPASSFVFRLFPETGYGNSILYLFTWMDPAKGQVYSGIIRNAGCSWEPGRFAIMVTLAMFCNLCQNGIKFKKNKNIWWFIIALVTTQSTTGFVSALILYTIFLIKKFNLKYIIITLVIMVPVVYGIVQLDFMGEKITTKMTGAQDVSQREQTFAYAATKYEEGEYIGSIDRFDAMVFEWMNVKNDPILGYSRNVEHSYFRTNISNNYVLANGLVKVFGMYGIFLGLYFFYILYRSSKKIAQDSNAQRILAMFILFCLSAISYQILAIPIFTTFWFYGLFSQMKTNKREIMK